MMGSLSGKCWVLVVVMILHVISCRTFIPKDASQGRPSTLSHVYDDKYGLYFIPLADEPSVFVFKVCARSSRFKAYNPAITFEDERYCVSAFRNTDGEALELHFLPMPVSELPLELRDKWDAYMKDMQDVYKLAERAAQGGTQVGAGLGLITMTLFGTPLFLTPLGYVLAIGVVGGMSAGGGVVGYFSTEALVKRANDQALQKNVDSHVWSLQEQDFFKSLQGMPVTVEDQLFYQLRGRHMYPLQDLQMPALLRLLAKHLLVTGAVTEEDIRSICLPVVNRKRSRRGQNRLQSQCESFVFRVKDAPTDISPQ